MLSLLMSKVNQSQLLVIDDGSRQYVVQSGNYLNVDYKSHWQPGETVKIKCLFGPQKEIDCEVLRHFQGPKKLICKNRRRKNSRSTMGFRRQFTELRIGGINGN